MHPDRPSPPPPGSTPSGSPPSSSSPSPSPEEPAQRPAPAARRERLPLSRTPVSAGVLILSILVFVVTRLLVPSDEDLFTLYGPMVAAGEWWRVLSTIVQHGSPGRSELMMSLLHIGMNMYWVWGFGRAYEFHLGRVRFAQISLISALASSAMVLWLAYDQPTVGASGMILGWVGAVLPITKGSHRQELVSVVVFTGLMSMVPGISWQGHLGGFLGGLACGLVIRRGGAAAFRYAAPLLTFLVGVATVLAVRMNAGP